MWLKNEGKNICPLFVKNQHDGLISRQSSTLNYTTTVSSKLVLQLWPTAYRPWIGWIIWLPHLEVCSIFNPKRGQHIFICTSFSSLSWVRPNIGVVCNVSYSEPTLKVFVYCKTDMVNTTTVYVCINSYCLKNQ